MRAGVARIELDRTAERSLRPFPIPIVHEQRPGERRVRRRNGFIELERFARVRLSARKALELDESRSEEHTSELQSRPHLVCRLLLEKKKSRRLPVHP